MESKTVKDAIDGLIMARPSKANKDINYPRDTKRLSLRRKSLYGQGGKCTCGRCTKCIPSPSGERAIAEIVFLPTSLDL